MDIVLRVAFVYLFLMVALRLMGKRELSEMSPFELVTLLLVPEIFSAAVGRGDYSLTNATIGVSTLFTLVFLTGMLSFRFKRFEQMVEGGPTVLVHDGKVIERHLRRERVTTDELFTEMRKSGVDDLPHVRWAILEADGKISIIARDQQTNRSDERQVK
jgi:uncharacterized membrane protein YcaP (DUF421 family)